MNVDFQTPFDIEELVLRFKNEHPNETDLGVLVSMAFHELAERLLNTRVDIQNCRPSWDTEHVMKLLLAASSFCETTSASLPTLKKTLHPVSPPKRARALEETLPSPPPKLSPPPPEELPVVVKKEPDGLFDVFDDLDTLDAPVPPTHVVELEKEVSEDLDWLDDPIDPAIDIFNESCSV